MPTNGSVTPVSPIALALDFADEQQAWANDGPRTPTPIAAPSWDTLAPGPMAVALRPSQGGRADNSPPCPLPETPRSAATPRMARAISSPLTLAADPVAAMGSFDARLRNMAQCTFAGVSCLLGAHAAAGLPFYGVIALAPAAVAVAGAQLGRVATQFRPDAITLATPADWGYFCVWQAGLGAAAAFVSMAGVGMPMSSAWLQAGAAVVVGQALGRAALVVHPNGFSRELNGAMGTMRRAGHVACVAGGLVLCAASLLGSLAASAWLWPLYLGSSACRAFLEAAEPTGTGTGGASALGRRVRAHIRLGRARACPAALIAIIFGTAVAAAPALAPAERLAVRTHMAGLGLALMVWP